MNEVTLIGIDLGKTASICTHRMRRVGWFFARSSLAPAAIEAAARTHNPPVVWSWKRVRVRIGLARH